MNPTAKALQIAIKVLREIEKITSSQSHGVEHIGRIVAAALWEIGDVLR